MSDTTTASAYRPYVSHLRDLASQALAGQTCPGPALEAALNGGAATELRRLVPRDLRRSAGAYFTGAAVRQRLTPLLRRYGAAPYFDPACGAGDLLLVAASQLGCRDSTGSTVAAWASNLSGVDLEASFVDVARSRLVLAAAARCISQATTSAGVLVQQPLSSALRVGDAREPKSWPDAAPKTVLLNPPYGSVSAPSGCDWGSGLVPRAAVFVDHVVDQMHEGATLIAILPDVLRSGSRLARWRSHLTDLVRVQHIERVGRFDAHANVDVFFLVATKYQQNDEKAEQGEARSSAAWWPENSFTSTIGQHFNVRVGPVVHNRDPQEGPTVPFAFARALPRSGTATIDGRRAFTGTLCKPPFVLMRRTSAPSKGSGRTAGVVVADGPDVAVDNHLIVLQPRDGSLVACERLVRVLEGPSTTKYLDDRIRCRHLTVGAVAAIPWYDA